MIHRLSPSDLTFLYEGCKRCFYLKVVHGIAPPSIPLPTVFTTMAALQVEHYTGKNTEELHPNLPPGKVLYAEQWVTSKAIKSPKRHTECYVFGRFDIVARFEDGTYGLIDFKTGDPRGEYNEFYGRQLHAYTYALEHPAPKALCLYPVTRMGLLYFNPSSISQALVGELSYQTDITWIEIQKDERAFVDFIEDVLDILASPEPPASSPKCSWCNYCSRLNSLTTI